MLSANLLQALVLATTSLYFWTCGNELKSFVGRCAYSLRNLSVPKVVRAVFSINACEGVESEIGQRLTEQKIQVAAKILVPGRHVCMFIMLLFLCPRKDDTAEPAQVHWQPFNMSVRLVVALCVPTDIRKATLGNVCVSVVTIFRSAGMFIWQGVGDANRNGISVTNHLPAHVGVVVVEVMVCFLPYVLDLFLKTVVKANLKTEHAQNAAKALLRVLCDAVAQLNPELQIDDCDVRLSRLLVKTTPKAGSSASVVLGTKFASHLATGEDRERFWAFIAASISAVDASRPQWHSAAALHVHMRDSSGKCFPVELLHAYIPSIDPSSKPSHLLGIRETGTLLREACAEAPVQVNVNEKVMQQAECVIGYAQHHHTQQRHAAFKDIPGTSSEDLVQPEDLRSQIFRHDFETLDTMQVPSQELGSHSSQENMSNIPGSDLQTLSHLLTPNDGMLDLANVADSGISIDQMLGLHVSQQDCRGSEISFALSKSTKRSLEGGLETHSIETQTSNTEALSLAAKQSSRGNIETCSVETQTLSTQALPPVLPADEAQRPLFRHGSPRTQVKLNTRRLMSQAFGETPKDTMTELVVDSLCRFNARGKGCCLFHISLHALHHHILGMMTSRCNRAFSSMFEMRWQCTSCLTLNELPDLAEADGDMECSLCGASGHSSNDDVAHGPTEDTQSCDADVESSAASGAGSI